MRRALLSDGSGLHLAVLASRHLGAPSATVGTVERRFCAEQGLCLHCGPPEGSQRPQAATGLDTRHGGPCRRSRLAATITAPSAKRSGQPDRAERSEPHSGALLTGREAKLRRAKSTTGRWVAAFRTASCLRTGGLSDRGRDSPSLCELGLPPARIPACASTHWALASGMTVEPRVGPGMHDAGGWEPSDR
jgi:hypothetical protein